jgi:hypothetical protein
MCSCVQGLLLGPLWACHAGIGLDQPFGPRLLLDCALISFGSHPWLCLVLLVADICASPNSAKQLHLVLRGLLEYATHICIEPFLIFSHSCVYLFTIYAVVMLVTSLLCNNFGKGYVHCPPSYVDITCLHFQNSERARIEAGPGERC